MDNCTIITDFIMYHFPLDEAERYEQLTDLTDPVLPKIQGLSVPGDPKMISSDTSCNLIS